MYNPLELSKKIEKIVVENNLKKYYRFRPTGFYGGIATADTVGCNLRCKFCWSSNSVWNAMDTGEFYSSEVVADTLQGITDKKGYHQLRISGGEPTIGKQHLIQVLESIKSTYVFILETNGILLGYDKKYVEDLSIFKNLHVRVCLKGADSEEFSLFTGAEIGFEYQLTALRYLRDAHMNFNIALVSTHQEKKQNFFKKLVEMNLEKVMIEEEEIKLYPMVRNRLQKEKLLHYFE
ncbi:7-carboxy-7-deazaguanine synthase [uncultured archaeon]|nr:7-carboxy-7-deazaguanine synthase [uncultured archaeon]